MAWLAYIGFVTCVLALVFHYWRELSSDTEAYPKAWFLGWMRRGVAVPIFVWLLMNVGSMPVMPPLTRHIGYIRGKGAWAEALMTQTTIAACFIVTFWGVLTFGWFLTNLFRRARNTDDLIIATTLWSPVLAVVTWFFWAMGGWGAIGLGVLFWIWPLTHYILGIADVKPPPPTYSQAIAKMKFGKYSDAEMAIIAQLEKCETDFDGWMMLADLYANHFNDLAEAEKAICDLCDEPRTTLPQVAVALHKLADWQLHLRSDPAAARRVLEEICRRMPGTHLDKMARHRINQLPKSVKELQEQQMPRKVLMQAWTEDLDAVKPAAPLKTEEAIVQANQLVEQLQQDPNDIIARERLARVFAHPLGKMDMAVEQLELLIEMPGQSVEKIAEWLGLIAAWMIEAQGECEKAQEILERLIHEFPQTPQAFVAQQRLSLMRVMPGGQRPKLGKVQGEDEPSAA